MTPPPSVAAASLQLRRPRVLVIWLIVILFVVYSYFSRWPSYIIFSLQDNVIMKESDKQATNISDSRKAQYKVLISQYSSGISTNYSILLNMTEPINRLYAERWGYDFYVLIGRTPETMPFLTRKGGLSLPWKAAFPYHGRRLLFRTRDRRISKFLYWKRQLQGNIMIF